MYEGCQLCGANHGGCLGHCEAHGAVHGNEKLDYFAMHGTTGTMEAVHDVGSNSCPFMTWESMFPRAQSLEYAKGLKEAFAKVPGHRENATAMGMYLVPMGNVFLIGVTIRSGLQTPEAEEHLRETWKAGAKYMRMVGSCSTYGQGLNSRYIAESWSPTYAKTMNAIKKALDPNGIMCPHPSFCEGITDALEAVEGMSIHSAPVKRQ